MSMNIRAQTSAPQVLLLIPQGQEITQAQEIQEQFYGQFI